MDIYGLSSTGTGVGRAVRQGVSTVPAILNSAAEKNRHPSSLKMFGSPRDRQLLRLQSDRGQRMAGRYVGLGKRRGAIRSYVAAHGALLSDKVGRRLG